MTIRGIQFVVDETGEPTGVLIDLREHGELWEDFYDVLLAEARQGEPRERFDDVKERLKRRGLLNGDE